MILITVLLCFYPAWAAKPSCQQLFEQKQKSIVQSIQNNFYQKHNFHPIVAGTFGGPIYIYGSTHQVIAKLKYKYADTQLSIIEIMVAPEYQKSGLSEVLLASALLENPKTRSIQIEVLIGENRRVYEDFLRRGLSSKSAFQQTPIYKVASKFGFTGLAGDSLDMGIPIFVEMRRPE